MTDQELFRLVILDYKIMYIKEKPDKNIEYISLEGEYVKDLSHNLYSRYVTIFTLYSYYKLSEEDILTMTHEERLTYLYLFKKENLND